MTQGFHLAELNMARTLYPLDDPRMAEFVENLERINGLAEQSAGFVWRLLEPNGDASATKLFEEPLLLVNLSVWEKVEDLFAYVYRSEHTGFWKRRREWFAPDELPQMVLWWIPRGHTPTLEEAKRKLELLREAGPTADAFDFKHRFACP